MKINQERCWYGYFWKETNMWSNLWWKCKSN